MGKTDGPGMVHGPNSHIPGTADHAATQAAIAADNLRRFSQMRGPRPDDVLIVTERPRLTLGKILTNVVGVAVGLFIAVAVLSDNHGGSGHSSTSGNGAIDPPPRRSSPVLDGDRPTPATPAPPNRASAPAENEPQPISEADGAALVLELSRLTELTFERTDNGSALLVHASRVSDNKLTDLRFAADALVLTEATYSDSSHAITIPCRGGEECLVEQIFADSIRATPDNVQQTVRQASAYLPVSSYDDAKRLLNAFAQLQRGERRPISK